MRKEYAEQYKYLGLTIAYHRKLKGMTQEQLAEEVGIDQTHLSKIERAAVGLSLDLLFAIADSLDVEPGKLFFKLN